MGYQHLQNAVKAIALTVPAARAFDLTVEFVLGEGKDTATVGRLEDHFRDRPAMKACIERMKADPAAGKCIDDRYLGPELDLDKLIAYPRGSLGYTYAKVMKHLGYIPHVYGDRPSLSSAARSSALGRVRPGSRCSSRSTTWGGGRRSRCTS